MIIVSAKFANHERSVVEVKTLESGPILVPVDDPDFSGGWRDVYSAWAQSNETAAYITPVPTRTAVEHFAAFGYDTIALLNLSDVERKFSAQSVDIPEKCAATRAWINAVQVAHASGQTLPDAPYTLPEILEEIAPLLQP